MSTAETEITPFPPLPIKKEGRASLAGVLYLALKPNMILLLCITATDAIIFYRHQNWTFKHTKKPHFILKI